MKRCLPLLLLCLLCAAPPRVLAQEPAAALPLEVSGEGQALSALTDGSRSTRLTLAAGQRLVGIISHVAELRERIDRQIRISKSPARGSRAQLVL